MISARALCIASRAPQSLRLSARPARLQAVRTMASAAQNSYHILQYSYVPDIVERRGPFRAGHLDGAHKQAEAGKLVMAGALAEPVDGAIFIFRNASKEEIEAFAKADPYVQNGLVPNWSIRPYMVVAGDCK